MLEYIRSSKIFVLNEATHSFHSRLVNLKSISMQEVSETISDYWATSQEVSDASLKAFKELYGGNSDVSLRKMRYV